MTKYAKIINDEIDSIHQYLPRQFKGIPEPQLKENGWYRVVEDTTQKKEWENESLAYSFANDTVTETKSFTNIPLEEWKTIKYTQLAKEAEQYIYSIYPSYKQLSALAGFYDTQTNDDIKAGVKTYFDIMQVVKTDLFAKLTHQGVADVYFKKDNYDEDGFTILSTTFWGE